MAADVEAILGAGTDLPSLSFSKQPAFKDLVDALISAKQGSGVITLFCGAGVSIDSGLPTWRELVQRLARRLENPELEGRLLAEESDLPKRVELIQAALPGDSPPGVTVSETLYARAGGQPPGQLAASIASLAKQLGSRLRVVTTNYDDRLELALSSLLEDDQEVESHSLDTIDAWRASTAPFKVLHLHGYLPSKRRPSDSELGPLVLSEASYMYWGSAVQNLVQEWINDSTLLIAGASMTDPSLIGPLHRMQAEKPASQHSSPFALWVPAPLRTEGGQEASTSHGYARLMIRYLSESLRVKPVILKSYGQMAQCVAECVLAVDEPTEYLSDDPVSSLRYGFRFSRTISAVHEAVGVEDGEFAPSGSQSRLVSESLSAALTDSNGPKAFLEQRIREIMPGLEQRLLPEDYFQSEQWALALWLRTHRPFPRYSAYEIFLAGTSSHSSRDGRTLGQRARVSPFSRFVASQSVYSGQVQVDTRPSPKPGPDRNVSPWLTFIGIPLGMAEPDVIPETTRPVAPVSVGSIVLESSRRLTQIRTYDLDGLTRDVSILSFLDGADHNRLYELVATATRNTVSALAETPSTS